jgi:hypothetical protein
MATTQKRASAKPKPVVDKHKPLTIKQAKLVKGIAEGKTNTQAALDAYDVKSPETAASMASENLRKPNVQEAIQQALTFYNLTPKRAMKPIVDGLEANKIQEIQGKVEELPDHSIRLTASRAALRLMGADNQEGGNTYNFVNINQGEGGYFEGQD